MSSCVSMTHQVASSRARKQARSRLAWRHRAWKIVRSNFDMDDPIMTQTTNKARQSCRTVIGKVPPFRVGTEPRHVAAAPAQGRPCALRRTRLSQPCTTKTGVSPTSRRSPNCRSSRCWNARRCNGAETRRSNESAFAKIAGHPARFRERHYSVPQDFHPSRNCRRA